AAVAIEWSQHRSRDGGDPLGVLAQLHGRMKGASERAVAVERHTDKEHVTAGALRQPTDAYASLPRLDPTHHEHGWLREAGKCVRFPSRCVPEPFRPVGDQHLLMARNLVGEVLLDVSCLG